MRFALSFIGIVLLAGCASAPKAFSLVKWQDERGDRGTAVQQRDLAWYIESVETRRSLVEHCMHERGWILAK